MRIEVDKEKIEYQEWLIDNITEQIFDFLEKESQKNMEMAYKCWTNVLTYLVAHFADCMIADKHFDEKLEIVDGICNISKLIIKQRDKQRNNEYDC